jgi:hypothetical protein
MAYKSQCRTEILPNPEHLSYDGGSGRIYGAQVRENAQTYG